MAGTPIAPGVAPATNMTQARLLFFLQMGQAYINDTGLVGDNATMVLLKYLQVLHESTNDDNRQFRSIVEKHSGVIDTIGADGSFDSLDGFEDTELFENFIVLAEEGGKYDIIYRNLGRLTQFINTIELTKVGMEDAAKRFVLEGYGQFVQQNMAAKMYSYIVTDLVAVLQAGTTTDVFKSGEKAFQAAAGTVFPFGNLVTASLNEDGIKAVMTNMMLHTDRNGNEIAYRSIKLWACSKANVTTLRELLFPGRVVNTSFKSPIDWDDEIPVIVGLKGLGDDEIYCIAGGCALEYRTETMSPFFTSGDDKDLNRRLHIRFIYGFGWTGRHSIVKWVVS